MSNSSLPQPDSAFWQTKLAAFVHDTPSKATDIAGHYERAAAALARSGLDEDTAFDEVTAADHTAAAADRIPFPFRQIKCSFNGSAANPFRHPLNGTKTFPFEKPFESADLAEETEQVTQPSAFAMPADWDEFLKSRANFFAHWRLWQKHAVEADPRFAFIPADTRIPDHTIWNHLGITSALASAGANPAFLKFHLGPVQSFIAAARSTRDLWSGSFLISWLMMTGLKKLSERAGPDSVVFPNLHGQPLFDAMWKQELWDGMKAADGARSVWESFEHLPEALTTPTLANLFLALVPADSAADIACEVETAIRDEWTKIAASVWKFSGLTNPESKNLFDAQIAAHWTLSWQTTRWPTTLDDAEQICAALPDLPEKPLLENFKAFRKIFEQDMPFEHRRRMYYTDDTKTKLNNIGAAWPLLVALNAWQLDAVRRTTAFHGWDGAAQRDKDALNGREEFITDGTGIPDWGDHIEPAGATTLVKRLWHKAYLRTEWSDIFTHDGFFSMPNTVATAGDESAYFAILALDGDNMGQFVSGAKAPPLLDQLAPPAREYFEKITPPVPDAYPRPLNPAYHLQFSQALSNFALHAVPPIIEKHGGYLLYAGGDDVLAMLPADKALACADALQKAFAEPFKKIGKITYLLPGTTSSVGVSLCHEKSPLQDAVREAQAAEKRAKKLPGKHAFAISVFKRSGEITEWEARFADGSATAALAALIDGMNNEIISSKFPHKLLEFIEPYRSDRVPAENKTNDAEDFPVKDAVKSDLALTLERQHGPKWNDADGEKIRAAISAYIDSLNGTPSEILRDLSGLLTVAAFLARQN